MTAWLTRIGLLLGTTVLGVVLGLWLTEPPPVRLVLDSHVYEVAPGDRAELARVLRLRARRAALEPVYLATPEQTFEFEARDLGFELDLARALSELGQRVERASKAQDADLARWLSRRALRQAPTVRGALPIRFD